MKITDYKITRYEFEMDRPIGDANGPYGNSHFNGAFLEIHTDEGITGLAPSANDAVGTLFHLVEGEDPRGVIGLWKKMQDFVFKGGNEGAMKGAIGSIDIALWDLKAKIADEPLWQTLGAREGRCKAYASGIDYCLSDEEIYKFYSRMADQGVDAGKLKVGLDMDADLRRLGIMKEALQKAARGRPQLCIDSNEYWNPKQAIRYINRIEQDFDLTWAEEPARRWDYDGLAKVSRNIKAAVATGENINDISDFYPLISNEAVDVVEFGAGATGITGAKQIGNLAFAYELPVALMNCQANFMAHLGAAMPNHMMLEVVDPGREKCMKWGHTIEDGFIQLSNKPGLGIEKDEEGLKKYGVTQYSKPSVPFPRREGGGLHIVPPEPGEVPWK
ncbi:MAG: mandelate racemase/muconate lactonizing enzyme family protein [Chloroflexota bacterium]